MNDLQAEFNKHATNGYLGDPNGVKGMAYLRVSSSGQAEEGRTGFPRQLLHVHEKARDLHLAIPWELIFFDDYTGFEFRDRPALTKLRTFIKTHPRPADDLVIENLDRLSREATWHQGFLLEELEQECKIKVHFWKELGSRIERAVYGTVAQDRMLTDLERMATGNRLKAKSGRVTARTPAYGYRLVDSTGGTANAQKDTHYAVYEPEAAIVRQIYTWLIQERATLIEISRRLTEKNIKPPKRSRAWEHALIYKMISNPVYQGQFFAHRYLYIKRISQYSGREATHKVQRPREEWIQVPVPALVTPQMWEAAQGVVKNNRTQSLRNTKRESLLVGLTRCAECSTKMSMSGRYYHQDTRAGRRDYESSYYRCGTRTRAKHIQQVMGVTCRMPQIAAKRLDGLVWNALLTVLLDPQQLSAGIDRYLSQQNLESTREEIAYLRTQLTELEVEDGRLYQAYVAQAFEAEEYAKKRHALKERRKQLEAEKEALEKKMSQQSNVAHKKREILEAADELRRRAETDIPFALKRKVVAMLVDQIIVNTRDEWFELKGAISGRFDFIPAGRDSWPRSA